MNLKIEVFVTDAMVANRFGVCRPDDVDEEQYQENCNVIDMSPYDIDIAVMEKNDTRCMIVTTCDRWNVYCVEENDGETTDVTNITSIAEEWETVNDIVSFLLRMK